MYTYIYKSLVHLNLNFSNVTVHILRGLLHSSLDLLTEKNLEINNYTVFRVHIS